MHSEAAQTLRLLFVDDEAEIVDSFITALQIMGHSAMGFRGPRAALGAMRENPDGFDAVISDFTLPEMSCPEFVAKLKEIRPGLPIYLCTGNTENEIQEAADRMGIRAILYKPFDYDRLAAFVGKITRPGG